MSYVVYILLSEKDQKRYIGSTSDLVRRLREHDSGLVKSTRYRRPLTLVYKEEYQSKQEAQKREKFFKTGRGREHLKKILATYPSG